MNGQRRVLSRRMVPVAVARADCRCPLALALALGIAWPLAASAGPAAAAEPPQCAADIAPVAAPEALSGWELERLAKRHGWELRRAVWDGAPEAYQVPVAARSDTERFSGWLLEAFGNAVELPMAADGKRVLLQLPPGLDAAWIGEARERVAAMAGRLGALGGDGQAAKMALSASALSGQPEWQALRDIAARQRGRAFRIRVAVDGHGMSLGAGVFAVELPLSLSSSSWQRVEGSTKHFFYTEWMHASFVELHDDMLGGEGAAALEARSGGGEGGLEEGGLEWSAWRAADGLHMRFAQDGKERLRVMLSGGSLGLEATVAEAETATYPPITLHMLGGAGSQWALWRAGPPGGGGTSVAIEAEALEQ